MLDQCPCKKPSKQCDEYLTFASGWNTGSTPFSLASSTYNEHIKCQTENLFNNIKYQHILDT